MKFFDTCALLELQDKAFTEPFMVSIITLQELENIKTSNFKDEDTKYKARKLVHLLADNQEKYKVIAYSGDSAVSNDDKIISCAVGECGCKGEDIFVTKDLCCALLARSRGLKVDYLSDPKDDYCGFKEAYLSEEALANIYMLKEIDFSLNINEYLLIKDEQGTIIDKFKMTKDGLIRVPYPCFDGNTFGKIKPQDPYQYIAMDSLKNNQITMIRGAAGTGKSYLAMGYLFDLLDHGKIDKIVIFCNTVATAGSAKLGYYPGTRLEKLLDSQIGNFLISKLGDREAVEQMCAANVLLLLPMSDIRGFDTTGMNAGVYITEAQNLDVELMKLALQRIGQDSVCILDGDSDAQVDLSIYAGSHNGMRRVSEVFRGEDLYGEVTLKEIHRSRIAKLAQKM